MSRIKRSVAQLLGAKIINVAIKISNFASWKDLKTIRKNKILRNKYIGKSCYIIGNGPSLKNQDLSLLKDKFVFTVNLATKLSSFSSIQTNIHLLTDLRFLDFDPDLEDGHAIIEVMKNVNLGSSPIVFLPIKAKCKIEELGLEKFMDFNYFKNPLYFDETFSQYVDFSKLVPDFPTVVQSAIMFAYYMGFRKIYLLGCDCTGFLTLAKSYLNSIDEDCYAYSLSKTDKQRIINTNTKYNSIEAELYSSAKIFDNYKYINSYLKKKGCDLVNCTDGGLLSKIPRQDFKQSLQESWNFS